jgi:hypothetical protein
MRNATLNRGLAMKTSLTLVSAALVLTGCSAFNTVQLYRDYTPYRTFLGDRMACVEEAQQCVWKTYAGSFYEGDPVEQLLPSRGVYLGCMAARGYFPVTNGFAPPVPVRMTDYRRGWDCFDR